MFEIGSTLRQARERRRLGLDQAEAETKIRARYLRALEDEDFEVLPGPAYVKGFLRTYAEYLGLDGTLFVDEYNSRFSDPYRDEELIFPRRRSQPPRHRRGQRESNVVLIALAGIVAVAVLVAVAFMYPTERTPPAADPVPSDTSTTTTPTSAAEDDPAPPMNGVISALQDEAEKRKQAQTESGAEGTQAAPVKPVRLVLRARKGECWVVLYQGTAAEGDTLFADTLNAADPAKAKTKRYSSKKGFIVDIGNPDNLELVVNGKVRSPGSATLIAVLPSGEVQALPS